jgi:hypothetical protein
MRPPRRPAVQDRCAAWVEDALTRRCYPVGTDVVGVTAVRAELCVRHGAGADTAARTLAKARAVVRAAVEAEALPDGRVEEHQPRLAVLRRGERVLIA